MDFEQNQLKLRKLVAQKIRKDSQRDLRQALEFHFATETSPKGVSETLEAREDGR
jgi:hypothetical protein